MREFKYLLLISGQELSPQQKKPSDKFGLPYARGFTLTEVVVALAITSILLAFAVPNYFKYVERGELADATSTLAELATRMEQAYLDNRKYTVDGNQCAVPVPSQPTTFRFSCISDGQTYTWSATSTDGRFQYAINNNGEKKTLLFAGADVGSGDCWVFSESRRCAN